MTEAEWESLCDRCGRCCLLKLMDEDTEEVYYTDIVCKLYDEESCQCADYENRQKKVHDCIMLTPDSVRSLSWLPRTCAYRLLKEGKDLYPWHPLVSGSYNTIHEYGVSTKGRTAGTEDDYTIEEVQQRIRRWPRQLPVKK